MTADLDELKARVERLRQLHFGALGSYHALVQMKQFLAPNIVGEDQAPKNAEALGRYKGYFSVARRALATDMYISIGKIYDNHKDALHIVRLVNYAASNNRALTAAATELADVYEGLTAEERQDISKDLAAADDKIERLRTIRNKIIAHEDLKGRDGIEDLSYDELSDLLKLSEKILNTISRKYYGNTVMFSVLRDDVIGDSQNLLRLIADDYANFQSQF